MSVSRTSCDFRQRWPSRSFCIFSSVSSEAVRRMADSGPFRSPLAVSSLVIEHGGDEDQAIVALLHDAIEDQGGPRARDEIMRRFGKRVTDIVEGCTDSQAHRQRFVGGREGTLW